MKTYRSRRSVLLGILLWGTLLAPVLLVKPFLELDPLFMVIYSLILAVVAFVWFGIKYQIENDLLLIMIGPMCVYKISIPSIESVNRSYNPLSSPAVSLRRIRLKFKGGDILISPVNEVAFVQDLKEINSTMYSGLSSEKKSESILARFVYAIL